MLILLGCVEYDLRGPAPVPTREPGHDSQPAQVDSDVRECLLDEQPAATVEPILATCQPLAEPAEWTMVLERMVAGADGSRPGTPLTLPTAAGEAAELMVTACPQYNVLGTTGMWLDSWSDPALADDLSTVSFRTSVGDFTAFTGTVYLGGHEPYAYSVSVAPRGDAPSFSETPTLVGPADGATGIGEGVDFGMVAHGPDNVPTLYDMRASWRLDGVPITRFPETFTGETPLIPLYLPASDDSDARLANAAGIWEFDTAEGLPWGREFVDRVFVLGGRDAAGELRVIVGGWGSLCSMNPDTGQAEWCRQIVRLDDPRVAKPSVAPALGDVDGDGVPEICAPWGEDFVLFDMNGDERWRVPRGENLSMGACVMADLDADGRYEIVDWSTSGLRILDGQTGATLADNAGELVDLGSTYDGPFVADIDADGSAEIFVGGAVPAGADSRDGTYLAIYGSPTNSWAATRPVWNQIGYDITTVNDDGSLVPWPTPVWDTFNAYRAQPAMAGDFADLQPQLLEVCAESCEDDGLVRLSVRAQNTGSRTAEDGIEIALLTNASGTLMEVARVPVPGAIDGMMTSASVELVVPAGQLGTRQFLTVYGPDKTNECNFMNDRVEVTIDVCVDEVP